jgi:hypothetical protein
MDLCFAYNEMQNEGWYNNRIYFRKNIKFLITKIIVIILIKKKYFSGYAFTPLDI